MKPMLRTRPHLAPLLLPLVLTATLASCSVETAPISASESEAFDRLQATLLRLVWPNVRVGPVEGDRGQVVATGAIEALRSRLDPAPTLFVQGQIDAACARLEAAPEADRPVVADDLLTLLRSEALLAASDVDETQTAFDRMQLFSIFWSVDVVRFLEAPETGPDVEILSALPHYASLKALLLAIDAEWQAHPPTTEADLLTPAYLDAAHAVAMEMLGFLLDLKANYAPDELTAWSFAGKWLAVDFDRYVNIADNGLPRFERVGLLNGIAVDQGEHFWSEWTVSDSPVIEAEAEKVRLIDDRRAVKTLWVTAAQEKLAQGTSEAAAALCSSRADLAAAVSAEATESARAPSNLANRLHDRLIATLRLAQDSSNAEVRAGASTP